jgi:hypothetical protein
MCDAPPVLTVDSPTGFPLVTFPCLPVQIGLLPLTWVQLEYFLTETSDRRFDAAWYQRRVQEVQRATTSALRPGQTDALFVRGLTIAEIQGIGRWWGGERFFVPTAQEWQQVADATMQSAPLDWRAVSVQSRASLVLEKLETLAATASADARTLADQMIMRGGMRELVMYSSDSAAAAAITVPPQRTMDREIIKRLDEGNNSRFPAAMRLFLRVS